VNTVKLFKQYKREQMADMQAEKDKIEAERAENQRMMQELLALKAQLVQQSGEAEATPDTTTAEQPNNDSSESAANAVEESGKDADSSNTN